MSFEPQIDKLSGASLGIVSIRFATQEEAKKCIESQHGKKLSLALSIPGGGEAEELRVVSDREGKLLKAVMTELDNRRRREREEKRKKEKEEKAAAALKATPTSSAGHTPIPPVHANNPWRNGLQGLQSLQTMPSMPNMQNMQGPPRSSHHVPRPPPPSAHLPMRPQVHTPMSMSNSPAPMHGKASPLPNGTPTGPRNGPAHPARIRKPQNAAFRGRGMHVLRAVPPQNIHPPIHLFPNGIESGPVLPPSLQFGLNAANMPMPIPTMPTMPFMPSRSPSPVSRRPFGKDAKNVDYAAVKAALAQNGYEHIAIDGNVGNVDEDAVRAFLAEFPVDQVRGGLLAPTTF